LNGLGVSAYVGNGGGGLTPPVSDPVPNANPFLEWWVHSSAQHFKAALDPAGVPSHYVDYGDGSGTARLRQALGAV
jgi:hypothetical protein